MPAKKSADELTMWLLASLVTYNRRGAVRSVSRQVPPWLCGVMVLLRSRGLCVFVGDRSFELTREGFKAVFGADSIHEPKDFMFAAGDDARKASEAPNAD